MPSLLPDYEYDIFISYRHNDNRSGWVTEFVRALQEELAATIKESLSIYFDKSPHDGLLETHSVDKSLEGKLKCLIFVPIISQTYCDPKSFAWQHEFCAFNKLAKEDRPGRDIKLSNGNVASRILPIKIHDIDSEDKIILENELQGVLRAVEFIYKEAGVNRPLNPDDKGENNLNGTKYRNQVNKVANAIKELIVGIRNPQDLPKGEAVQVSSAPKPSRKKIAFIAAVIAVLSLAGISYYWGGFENKFEETVDKSIAVLPFVNMSGDPEQEYFSDGISEEVLNLLAKVPDLKVTGRASSFYFKGKNEDLRAIGEKLGVAYLLDGSVRKDGNQVRINAQLIRSSDGTHVWSETYDRKLEGIFKLQDEIAADVLKELKIKLLGLLSPPVARNSEAHNLFLKGNYYFNKADLFKAVDSYQKSLNLDSSNAAVWTALSTTTFFIGSRDFMHAEQNFLAAKRCAEKALALDENFSDAHRVKGLANLFEFEWDKAELEFNMALKLDPNNSEAYRNMGILKSTLGRPNEALNYSKKSVELNPLNVFNLNREAWIYVSMKEYEQAAAIYKEAGELNPDEFNWSLFTLYLYSDQPQLALKILNELGLSEGDEKIRMMAMIDYVLGKKEEARTMVKKTLGRYQDSSYEMASILAFMNEKDEAFKWLEKAVQERFGIINLKQDPDFANLRGDSRYVEILKRMRLPLD